MISGQFPTREWRDNPDGRTRTIEEALEIVRKLGLPIPDDVAFFVDELGELDERITARGPRVDKSVGEPVHWSDLVHDKTGKVPFRIWPGILRSDEAIVAVISHEMYELEKLRPLLHKGTMSIDDFIAQTEPGRAGNYHDEAWNFADKMVDRMRRDEEQ
jgi:hypothetical protein